MKQKIASMAAALFLLGLFACGEHKQQPGTQEPGTSPGTSEREPGIDDVIDVDEPPSVATKVEPVYPEDAMRDGIEGTVWVKVLVNKEGTVTKAVVTKTIGGSPSIEKAALDAVRQFTFTPARIKKQPVQTWISFPFKFKLAPKK